MSDEGRTPEEESEAQTDTGATTQPDAEPVTEADAATADASPSEEESPAAEAPTAEQLEAARAEADALRDTALRAQAEMENVRKRAARDVENAHKFALEKFAGDLLAVMDSLEKSVEAAAEPADIEAFGPIREGIELSEKLMRDTLGRHGVEVVDPIGEPFDPERHEAMSMIEAPDAEPNSVVNVLQKGYVLNGRLMRAAMVIVARAPAG